jgi:type II secretory pathway component GspD/PulD (secretin)
MLEQPAGETIPQALQEKLSTGPNVPPSAPGQEAPPPPAYHPPASEKPKEAALPAAITPSTPTPPPPPYPTAVPAPSISTAPTTLQPLSTVPGGPGAPAVGASVGGPNGTSIMRTKNAVVAVDTNTNTLIVVAPPAIQQIYRQLILALDKRRPQVLIEVTMVTLDTSNDFSLGIELTQGRTNNEIKWLTFSSFGLSTIDPATAIPAIAATPGLNGVLLDPNAINVVVKALATNARAKVLSAPRVLVNDNATGTLSSVSESPFTSVNASNTVATTSFAGYASAGTTVALTPHISQDDYLRMAYSLTLSSFSGATGGSVPPPRQTNTVNSEVVIPDGYTIVVGGLKREDTSDTVSKVPLLGDIPGLGYLFSNLTKSKKESCLFVFIRPLILRDDQFKDLKYLSELDTAKAELPKGMPESEPMPMR